MNFRQDLHDSWRKLLHVLAQLPVNFLQKIGHQIRNILLSLMKRRKRDLHDFQTIIEIFPEFSLLDQRFEILGGCGDDPGFSLQHLLPSNLHEISRLDDSEQFRLKVRRKIPGFIQEESPFASDLELSFGLTHSISEGSFDVSEELAL